MIRARIRKNKLLAHIFSNYIKQSFTPFSLKMDDSLKSHLPLLQFWLTTAIPTTSIVLNDIWTQRGQRQCQFQWLSGCEGPRECGCQLRFDSGWGHWLFTGKYTYFRLMCTMSPALKDCFNEGSMRPWAKFPGGEAQPKSVYSLCS